MISLLYNIVRLENNVAYFSVDLIRKTVAKSFTINGMSGLRRRSPPALGMTERDNIFEQPNISPKFSQYQHDHTRNICHIRLVCHRHHYVTMSLHQHVITV